MTMTTIQTKLLPLDYCLQNENIFSSLNKYTQGAQVSEGESDDDAPKVGLYTKKKKSKSKKKKGGKKSTSKKKKKSGKKKK